MFGGWTLLARIVAPLALLGLLAAGVWGYGLRRHHAGVLEGRAQVQQRWDAAAVRQREVDAAERARQADAAASAAAQFEALRRDQAIRQAKLAQELRDALRRPISCSAGQALGDVVVPAAVLGGLRRAGADGGDPPRPATGSAGR